MILRVIKGYLSFLREWMLAGPLHSTCLVIVCVRFSLSLLEALCVVLSATHSSLGPMTCFTYLPPCFFHDAYLLLPLLASSFTFLFQASICACLLSSTESRWPLYKKKKKERESLGQTGQLYYLTFLSFKPCFICSLPSWSLNCRLYVTVLNYSNKANSLFWWK